MPCNASLCGGLTGLDEKLVGPASQLPPSSESVSLALSNSHQTTWSCAHDPRAAAHRTTISRNPRFSYGLRRDPGGGSASAFEFPVWERLDLTSDGSDLISLKKSVFAGMQKLLARCKTSDAARQWSLQQNADMAYGMSSHFQIQRTEKKSETRNAIILEFKMIVLGLAIFKCQVQISIADTEIPREIWPSFGEQRKISNLYIT